jgi:hypothetical protein
MSTTPGVIPVGKRQQYDELGAKVVASGNVLTTDMRDLRDRVGAGKLGKYVVDEISDELKKRGLGHTPLTLDQWSQIRIWKQGTRVGKFIEAASTPGHTEDELLRELADSQADDIVKQIRSLVCA